MNDLKGQRRKLADSFPVAYVSLNVSNLEKSLQFYQSVIGLHVLLIKDRTAILGTFEGMPLLMLAEQSPSIAREPGTTGIDHFALLVPNRIELARQLQNILERDHPISMISDHGVNESVYTHDPDRNLVEITRDLNAEELAQHMPLSSQQLADQLLNITRQSSFSELSQDRKIGHVLLRVSNLMEAERYYTEEFDLQVSMRIPSAVFVSSGNYHHHLGFHVWESEGGPPPDPLATGLRYFGLFEESDHGDLSRFVQDSSGNGIMLTRRTYVNPHNLIEQDQHFLLGLRSKTK